MLAFDTETHLISDTCVAPPLVCVSWAVPGQSGIFLHNGDGLPHDVTPRTAVAQWLDRRHLVGHNLAFDTVVLASQFPDLLPLLFQAYADGRMHDTMLREKLRDIAFGEFRWRKLPDGSSEKVNYHLADLAARRLGLTLSKGEDTWRLRYRELENVPLAQWPDDAVSYSILDSTTTLGVCEAQEAERARILAAKNIDILADEAAQTRAAFWMQLMSAWGMPLDPRKVDALEVAITTERNALEEILLAEGLVRIEYYSPHARDPALRGKEKKRTRNTEAAKAYMTQVCADLGVPVRTTKKGGVCLDAEACEDTDDEVLEAYANYTALGNVLGKDVKAMSGAPRIHARFDSLVASGRTACRGFNLQNLRTDGDTRGCFVAPLGYVFCLIDLKAAELYAVAQLCIHMFGRSRLAEVLNANQDPHIMLAANVRHSTYEAIEAAIAAGDPTATNSRKVGKHANYGLWGGMREKRFAALVKKLTHGSVTLSPDETHELREAFLRTWPEAPAYLGHFERLCSGGRHATILQYRSNRIRGGLRYSEACNTGFQGLIADLMKDAGFRLSREMYDWTQKSLLYGSRIVNFPHDEIISVVPEATAHECAQRIQDVVLETGREWLPDVHPTGDVYLARYWSKKAFPMYDSAGRRVPWNGEKKS